MAPAISVVVPVYNVEAYVRSCLESVLATREVDIEVIVVEDRSTDASPSIVREIAARDARVQVIELEKNAGLGNARNVGLDHACGEWILFLDSDDELTQGGLAAMLGLGERTDADMVMFDYARLYWDGERIRNNNAPMFAEGEGPVTLTERPELLNNLNVAWNKLYRRSFLERVGLRFPPGIYEDIPWTYPLLLTADRIALLDRVALLYRQRREGSILRSSSPDHFDLFDQYDRLFAWFDQHPESAWAREVLHAKMAAHLLTVFDHGERRLPRGYRPSFYHRMSETLVRHAPADYQPSGRLRGLRRRVVLWDRYGLEQTFQTARRGRRSLARSGRGITEGLGLRKNRLGTFIRLAYYRFQLRRPIDKQLAVFASYWYSQCSGNPKAISDAVARLAPEYRRVWLIERASVGKVPDSEEVVVVGSWAYYKALATASILVDNANFPNFLRRRDRTIHVQTQHGTPLKSMGLDLQGRRQTGHMDFEKLLERVDRWDFVLSSNRYSTEVWAGAFPARFRTLEYGYPRNDVFFGDVAARTERVRDELGIAPSAKVILYAPTFRDHREASRLDLDLVLLSQALPGDVVLLVRAHYFDDDLELQAIDTSDNIRDVSRYPDVQDLCLASDVLVTDYSSIMFDYANLGRPIVVYAPDWDTYRDVRGVYFDLLSEPPGPVVRTQDDLEKLLRGREYDNDESRVALLSFQRKFCEFDDGHAADRVVRRVFLGEALPDRFDDLVSFDGETANR